MTTESYMATEKFPVTQAVRFLRASKIEFEEHLYEYVEKGGTKTSAAALGVDEYAVIKTLVMQDHKCAPLLVLMHGTHRISTKKVARFLGTKIVSPCDPEVAARHTGYQVGGTSPFGTRKRLRVLMQASIADLPQIYINGGKRGFLVSLDPKTIVGPLRAQLGPFEA